MLREGKPPAALAGPSEAPARPPLRIPRALVLHAGALLVTAAAFAAYQHFKIHGEEMISLATLLADRAREPLDLGQAGREPPHGRRLRGAPQRGRETA